MTQPDRHDRRLAVPADSHHAQLGGLQTRGPGNLTFRENTQTIALLQKSSQPLEKSAVVAPFDRHGVGPVAGELTDPAPVFPIRIDQPAQFSFGLQHDRHAQKDRIEHAQMIGRDDEGSIYRQTLQPLDRFQAEADERKDDVTGDGVEQGKGKVRSEN